MPEGARLCICVAKLRSHICMPVRPWSRLAKYLRGRAQYCLCGRGFDNETVIVFVACEVLKLRFKVLPGLAKCQYNCLPEGVRVCI